jgi:hypothetical protein
MMMIMLRDHADADIRSAAAAAAVPVVTVASYTQVNLACRF